MRHIQACAVKLGALVQLHAGEPAKHRLIRKTRFGTTTTLYLDGDVVPYRVVPADAPIRVYS